MTTKLKEFTSSIALLSIDQARFSKQVWTMEKSNIEFKSITDSKYQKKDNEKDPLKKDSKKFFLYAHNKSTLKKGKFIK